MKKSRGGEGWEERGREKEAKTVRERKTEKTNVKHGDTEVSVEVTFFFLFYRLDI